MGGAARGEVKGVHAANTFSALWALVAHVEPADSTHRGTAEHTLPASRARERVLLGAWSRLSKGPGRKDPHWPRATPSPPASNEMPAEAACEEQP